MGKVYISPIHVKEVETRCPRYRHVHVRIYGRLKVVYNFRYIRIFFLVRTLFREPKLVFIAILTFYQNILLELDVYKLYQFFLVPLRCYSCLL